VSDKNTVSLFIPYSDILIRILNFPIGLVGKKNTGSLTKILCIISLQVVYTGRRVVRPV
jgi:hypothetical protein